MVNVVSEADGESNDDSRSSDIVIVEHRPSSPLQNQNRSANSSTAAGPQMDDQPVDDLKTYEPVGRRLRSRPSPEEPVHSNLDRGRGRSRGRGGRRGRRGRRGHESRGTSA